MLLIDILRDLTTDYTLWGVYKKELSFYLPVPLYIELQYELNEYIKDLGVQAAYPIIFKTAQFGNDILCNFYKMDEGTVTIENGEMANFYGRLIRQLKNGDNL